MAAEISGRNRNKHVCIVGAGIAGLTAARILLQEAESSSSTDSASKQNHPTESLIVTLVEATNRVGGRIFASPDLCESASVDLGAEYVHCTGTILTDWIKELHLTNECDWEQIFVTAHADGGPDEEPTRDGKYGMYFMDGKLHMYDDEAVKPVEDALHEILESRNADATMSVADALAEYQLSPSLHRLAIAGYGNTAGCTDMSKLSLSMLQHFEHHWENNEIDGDYRLKEPEGMYSFVRAILADLQKHNDNFKLLLDWPVDTIKQDVITMTTSQDCQIVVTNQQDRTKHLLADAVIVTVPPPKIGTMVSDLSTEQRSALEFLGFDTAIKVILKFDQRPWPEELQSVVCADGSIPEIWFREFHNDHESCYIMVNFLVSDIATNFSNQTLGASDGKTDTIIPQLELATNICLEQLASMLKTPIESLRGMHMQTMMHDWKKDEPFIDGGYLYPKVGLEPHHLKALSEPVGQGRRIFLAGEATNANAFCTVQSAMETGVRSARQVQELLL